MMHIGWPEGIWIGLVALRLIIYAAADGQPMKGTYKFSIALLGSAISFGLLFWGGFFS
jgi:hypothetical protein